MNSMKAMTTERDNYGRKEALLQKMQVRCGQCGKLLGVFEVAKGEIKCPRCHNAQEIDIPS